MLSYVNGKFVETENLSLPVVGDLIGTVRGFRVFTACRTLPNGKVFRLEDHVARLLHSAEVIHMEVPHSPEELKEIIESVAEKNKENQNLLLEIVYSGGPAAPNGIAPAGKAVLYIFVFPLKLPPEEWYQKGVKLASFPYQRQWPEAKLLSYVGAVVAHQTVVKENGADEALFVSPDDKKIVLEGTTFSFFAVKHDVLLTHALDGKILFGVTRKVVLELVRKNNWKVEERDFSLADLAQMDEAFLCSCTRNIVPVVQVDDIIIGNGQPGPQTLALAEIMNEYQKNY